MQIEETIAPAAERGFIDFWVDAERAAKQVPKVLSQFAEQTTDVGRKMTRWKKKLGDAAGNARKAQGVASDVAKDIDRYSTFIEGALPELRATPMKLPDSWMGYLETSPEATDPSKKGEIAAFRDTVQELLNTTRTTRESIAGFRNSVLTLRQRNASQRLNAATDRLADDLASVVSVMKDLEGAQRKVVGLATKRLQEMS